MFSEKEKQIFAILFAAGEPVSDDRIASAVVADISVVLNSINSLEKKLCETDFPVRILKLNNSYQLATCTEYAKTIKTAVSVKKNTPLSQAAMEVLAIIAYNQPVTKGYIEQIRGVDSSSIVNSLVEKDLIEEHGRLEIPGRPIAYKTNDNFLRSFGMETLEELPKVNSLQENEQLKFESENT